MFSPWSTEAPGIKASPWAPDIEIGDPVASVTCSLRQGSLPVTFKWIKDGMELRNSERTSIKNYDRFSTLEIRKVSASDRGNYTCYLSNEQGVDSYTFPLNIRQPPVWVKEPSDISSPEGKRISIPCSASGIPDPVASWTSVESTGTRLNVHSDGSLLFESLHKTSAGKYTCRVSNGIGSGLTKTIEVKVNAPASFSHHFSMHSVKKGDSVKLECDAKGDSPITITWSKNSTLLSKTKSTERYEILDSLTESGLKSDLILRSAEKIDSGLYVCIASNSFGSDERINKVYVAEAPSSPVNLAVREIWSTSAHIYWLPPVDSSVPISGYVIQYWMESHMGENKRLQEKQVAASQNSLILDSLSPGSSYEITVVGFNDVGRGLPSSALKIRTGQEEPSGVPLDIMVEPKGPTTIRVSWRSPPIEKWNGKLLGFYVGYRLAKDYTKPFALVTIPFGNFNFTYEYFVTGLARGTEYAIIVKAYNSAGSGPEPQEIVAKTLSAANLLPAPEVFLLSTTTTSIFIMFKTIGSEMTPEVLNGFTVHYRSDSMQVWKESSVPVTGTSGRVDYVISDLEPNTLYHFYVTAVSANGNGDPSQLMTVRTKGVSEEAMINGAIGGDASVGGGGVRMMDGSNGRPSYFFSNTRRVPSVIIVTTSVVIIILAITVSYVCIRKAQLAATATTYDYMAATTRRRSIHGAPGTEKAGDIYLARQYVEFDATGRPMTQGNITHLVDAAGNLFPAPYSTIPIAPGTAPAPGQPRNWTRPLPSKPTASKPPRRSLSGKSPASDSDSQTPEVPPQEHEYDYAQ